MWSFPLIDDTGIDFTPACLGELKIESMYKVDKEMFVSDDIRVSYYVRSSDLSASKRISDAPSFECAGPRERIFFDPAELVCGIVTCGGLCPGLNDVIRTITLTLQWEYNVTKVLGFRFGYQGLSANPLKDPMELTPDSVDAIQNLGGTILGTSRGHQEPAEMVETLKEHNVRMLFVIGGDGTFAGAHAIWKECERQKLSYFSNRHPQDGRQRHIFHRDHVRLRNRRGRGPQNSRPRTCRGEGLMEWRESGQADGPGLGIHSRWRDHRQW